MSTARHRLEPIYIVCKVCLYSDARSADSAEEMVGLAMDGERLEYVDTPVTVRFGETDMMGVVYHANYLLYFEDSREDFLDRFGFSYFHDIEEKGYTSPIHAIDVKYSHPMRFGDEGYVRTTIAVNKPMRTVYHHRVFRNDQDPEVDKPLVDAHVTVCLVDRKTFKPVNIKKAYPELFAAYETAKEDSGR